MGSQLAKQFIRRLLPAHVIADRWISGKRVWLYVQSTPEHFNATVADNITLLQERHGFDAREHSDWVHPVFCCKKKFDGQPESSYPLNSWAMKDPVVSVPSIKHLREQYDWYAEHAYSTQVSAEHMISAEEMQETYILKACQELQEYEQNLVMWKAYGSPREQEECIVGLNRQNIKSAKAYQRKNLLSAKQVMDGFKLLYAPRFLQVAATAIHARECAISDQLEDIKRDR